MAISRQEAESRSQDYAAALRETKRQQEIDGTNGGVYRAVVGFFAQQDLQPQNGRIRIHEDEELREGLRQALEERGLSFGQLINKNGYGIVSSVFKGMAINPDQIIVKMGQAGSGQKTSDISILSSDFKEICDFCVEQEQEQGLKTLMDKAGAGKKKSRSS